MNKPESVVLKEIQLEAAKHGCVLFRNNRGMFLSLDGKRKQRAGLEINGAGDLIGWTSDGKFLSVEVKKLGKKPSPAQENFIFQVLKFGGIAFVCDDSRRFKELLYKHL
jgi:hypothetical protein